MCGLVGIVGNLSHKDEAAMKVLLMNNYLRGQDSTGFAGIRVSGEAKIAKVASNPIDLFNMNSFIHALNAALCDAFMGHNRMTTSGKTNTASSHPFHYGDIIGAHNGTLTYASHALLEEKLGEKFSVDSQALIAAIDRFGIEETVSMLEEGTDSIRGAWAITWYDQKDKTFNVLRNKHRTLYYAYDKEQERLFYASEWWMIDAAVAASKIGYEFAKNLKNKKGDENVAFYPFEENVWYKFKVREQTKSKALVKPVVKTLKGREPKKAVTSSVSDPFGRSVEKDYPNLCGFRQTETSPSTIPIELGTPTGTATKTNSQKKTGCSQTQPTSMTMSRGTNRTFSVIEGTEVNPYGGWVIEHTFQPMAESGCAFCQSEITYGTKGVTIIEEAGILLCPKCVLKDPDKECPSTKIYLNPVIIEQAM